MRVRVCVLHSSIRSLERTPRIASSSRLPLLFSHQKRQTAAKPSARLCPWAAPCRSCLTHTDTHAHAFNPFLYCVEERERRVWQRNRERDEEKGRNGEPCVSMQSALFWCWTPLAISESPFSPSAASLLLAASPLSPSLISSHAPHHHQHHLFIPTLAPCSFPHTASSQLSFRYSRQARELSPSPPVSLFEASSCSLPTPNTASHSLQHILLKPT